MADAALAAHELTGDARYLTTFRSARAGSTARTARRHRLIDPESHACFDGLAAAGVNRNQGAESTLAYLWVGS